MQYACAILSSVCCPALRHFSILSHKWYKFLKTNAIERKMYVFISSIILSTTFLTLRSTERDIIKNVYWFLVKNNDFWKILIKLEFSRKIFEKCSNIKFHETPSTGSRAVPWGQRDGRTDGYDEANSRISLIQERAQTRTIYCYSLCS
jgi:hypothetical protein